MQVVALTGRFSSPEGSKNMSLQVVGLTGRFSSPEGSKIMSLQVVGLSGRASLYGAGKGPIATALAASRALWLQDMPDATHIFENPSQG